MDRRTFLGVAGAAAAPRRPRPSVLVILCDQLNPLVLNLYGGPVSAPNIERLARRGVTFQQATCPTPFCSPSRASLVTGLYPHRHGIVHNVMRRDYPSTGGTVTEEGLSASDSTYDKILAASGYRTHQYGKWHLSGDDLSYYPDQYGEHRNYAIEMAATFEEVRMRPREEWMDWYGWALPVHVDPAYRAAAADVRYANTQLADFIRKAGRLDLPLEDNFDIRVADRACETLRNIGRDPFSITCSFNTPHDPNVAPSPFYESVDPKQIRLPANFQVRERRFEDDLSRRMVGGKQVCLRELLRIYYASVKLLDAQVGRVLDALEATGRARDTIVVFTSDHGDMAGGHGMFWKSTSAFYEEVVRVPLIISYPAAVKPGTSDAQANLTDLAPTLLELTSHRLPPMQGKSMAALLTGASTRFREFSFSERVEPNAARSRQLKPGVRSSFMVRSQEWKYCFYPDGGEYLYHLRRDPGECENLAGESQSAGRKQEMLGAVRRWFEETGYPGGSPV